ncbi:MAG: oligosaccharide flippase family protein, partial [Gemmatimonadetes bacterium]|nr:oligosaccharide flippase family protein [Gemmatimonadota bacterium]
AATSEALLNAYGAIRRLAASKVTTTVVSLAATAVLVVAMGLEGSLLQIVAGTWIAAGVTWVALRGVEGAAAPHGRAPGPTRGKGVLKAVFALGLAQIVMHGAANLNLFLFRSILVLGEGEVAAGLYQGTMGLSRQYTAAFSAALYVYAYPRLSQRTGEPGAVGRELADVFRFVMAVGIPVALVLLAGRDLLVALVFTSEFRPMVPLMAWSLAVDPFQIVVLVMAFAVLATSSPAATVALALVFESAHLTAFIWGMSLWGVQGAVAAYGGAAAVGAMAYGGYLWRRGAIGPSTGVYGRMLLGAILVGLASQLPLTGVGRLLSVAAASGWLFVHRTEIRTAFRA